MPRVFLLADELDAQPPTDVRCGVPTNWPGVLRCRSALRDADPDLLHVEGPSAVRLAYAILKGPRFGWKRTPKVIASGADRPGSGVLGWLTVRGLRMADRVVARTAIEAERYKGLGVESGRITVIPPGAPTPGEPLDPQAFRQSLNIPANGRLIVAAGRFDSAAGLKSAVWAFDVVKYTSPDLYLVLIGDGPERDRLERFGKALGFDDYRIRYAGVRSDLAAVFALAEVAWVTHERGGIACALAAMAAGRPVVAARTPDLAAVVVEGMTGRFVPPTDRIQLAAVTHDLLDHPDVARQLGDAGRQRAEVEFPAKMVVERFAALYDELAVRS